MASDGAYRCPAKINLTLEVLHRRADGYHELASVMVPLSLSDTLRVAPDGAIQCRVKGWALAGDDNLVLRAAHLLAAETGATDGARCTLTKRIPVAAGLGGGSSDAAVTLVALDRLWQTGLSPGRLSRIAQQVGSDVPFFLRPAPALVRGRGETVEPLQRCPTLWLVLAVPDHQVRNKTAALFASLQPADFSDGRRSERLARRLESGAPPAREDQDVFNVFERAALAVFPGLRSVRDEAEARTGRSFHLSGAGPALFTVATDRADARSLARQIRPLSARVFAARTPSAG